MQLCSCSYENEMVLGFTSKLPKDNIQRNFLNMLKKEEIPYTEKTNNFPGCSLKEKKEAQRIVQVFNFVCIAAAILCGMINYLTREKLDWFWFAAAGCLCGWLIVAVAYAKRRNILKNEIIQLILVTVIAVLWDKYTGWHGWSLDFVASIWRSCSAWLYTCDRKSTKAGKRRVSVLPCSSCFCWSGTADPYVFSPDPFPIPICGMHRNQSAGICRNVYF